MARLKQIAKNSVIKEEKLTNPIVSNPVIVDIPKVETSNDTIYRIPTINTTTNYSIVCDYLESDQELFLKSNLTFLVSSIHSAITKNGSIKTRVTLSSIDIPNIQYNLILKVNSMETELPFRLRERYHLVQGQDSESFELKLIK